MAIIAVCLLILMRNSSAFHWFQQDKFCQSEECLYHATVIATRVNDSVSPCDDFAAYSCSRWKARAQGQGSALMREAMGAWFQGFEENLRSAFYTFPTAATRLLEVYNSCAVREVSEHERRQDVFQFKELARQLKIPWPDLPSSTVDPLGVLIDLTINWEIDLWFRLRILDLGGHTNKALLFFKPGGLITDLADVRKDVFNASTDETHWDHLYKALAHSSMALRPKEHIRRIASNVRAINKIFIAVVNNAVDTPAWFDLQNIQSYTANISALRWIQQINENVRLRDQFELWDNVFVSDVALLEAINSLFLSLTWTELLESFSWTFVQVLAPVVDRRVLSYQPEDTDQQEMKHRNFCASIVEYMYGWLIVSLHVHPVFPPAHRHAFDRLFTAIRTAALRKLATLEWLDERFKQWAGRRVLNVETLLWPPEQLLTDSWLMQAYSAWFGKGMTSSSSFFQFWLRSAMAKRHVMTKGANLSRAEALLASARTAPKNYVLPYFAYDNLHNSVAVSVAAISTPYFHGPGTRAMRHGGLGFPYAIEMVRAFDPSVQAKAGVRGMFINQSVLAAWKEEIARKAAASSALCSTKVSGDRKTGAQAVNAQPFPEVPAIEVAYNAFEASLDHERVPAPDVVKEKQVFFIASCLATCSPPGTFGRFRFDCNKAVANFRPFQDAFNCPNRVEINPTDKCGFFD